MGSGVMINLLIAFFLFAVVFMGYGVPTPTTTVSGVSSASSRSPRAPPTTLNVSAPSPTRLRPRRRPAEPGDRIVAFNGTPVTEWEQIQRRSDPTGTRPRPSSSRATAHG